MRLKGKKWYLCTINNTSKTGPTNTCFVLVQLSASLFFLNVFDHCFDLQRTSPHIWRNPWNSNKIHKYLSKLMGKKITTFLYFLFLFNHMIFMATLYEIYSDDGWKCHPRCEWSSRPGWWFHPESRAVYRKTDVPGLKYILSEAERGRDFGAGQVKQSWLLPLGS